MTTPDPIHPATREPCILVVDDVPKNIQLVGSVLSQAGYDVMPATSGQQALQRVQSQLPDLILLDLMMPEMDGLEVCRRLKQEARTVQVPVLFLTASNESDHLVQAFAAGAVDYVTKPFNASELLARVRTHLELKEARERLERQSQRLRQLNDEKNEFLGIAAHDLRNPLHNILSAARMVLDEPDLDPGAVREMLELAHASAKYMLELVSNLLDVNALERGEMRWEPQSSSLAEIVNTAVESHYSRASAKHQRLDFQAPEDPLTIWTDAKAARQITDNLVSNAVKYSPPGQCIEVRLAPHNGSIRLEVQDHGPGLSASDQARLFGKFARLSAQPTGGEASIGLGLSIVQRMVAASGGRVWCESEPGQGATFIVEWPREAPPVPSAST